jgi:hypothetical protein
MPPPERTTSRSGAQCAALDWLTVIPNFLHAAMILFLTSARVTPFMGYWAAFFGMLMYDQAALACAAVSIGYLPFSGSA